MTDYIGVQEQFHAEGKNLVRVSSQDFPVEFWKGLDWAREQDRQQRCPDLWRVGSIPALFVEKWLRDGFDIYRAGAREIVHKCKAEGLDDFVTTGKRV